MDFETLLARGLIQRDVALGPMTTYRRGGSARWYYPVANAEEMQITVPGEVPILIVGRGSNLVVASSGFPGLVMHLQPMAAEIRVEGQELAAPGGCPLPLVARGAAEASLGGLAFYVGIPGTVGGAVRMNAGCHGSETSDVLLAADTWDLRRGVGSTRGPLALGLTYRHSALADEEVVLAARFLGVPSSQAVEEAEMREVSRWRRENQPGGTFNAGSVFKNPPGDSAGRLIDSLGLKGFRLGGAVVSERHANFIEADADGTPEDVHRLMRAVQRVVEERAGVTLVPEIRFVGFDE
jgi:UDP-N-acetylmuramate dehydrogenase